MDWDQTTATDGIEEWTRADGNATIRLRQRADSQFAVRLDRLYQADEDRGYAYEVVDNRAAAESLVDDWQRESVTVDADETDETDETVETDETDETVETDETAE